MAVKIAQHQTTILQNQLNLDCQIKKILLQKFHHILVFKSYSQNNKV